MKIKRKNKTFEVTFEPKDVVKSVPKDSRIIAFIKKDGKHFRINYFDGVVFETPQSYVFSLRSFPPKTSGYQKKNMACEKGGSR